MLLLCVGPKPVPVIVTVVPVGPEVGEMLVTESASITENCTPLLVTPSSTTVTGPLVAPDGTVAVMLVALHELTLAATPLKKTWLLP